MLDHTREFVLAPLLESPTRPRMHQNKTRVLGRDRLDPSQLRFCVDFPTGPGTDEMYELSESCDRCGSQHSAYPWQGNESGAEINDLVAADGREEDLLSNIATKQQIDVSAEASEPMPHPPKFGVVYGPGQIFVGGELTARPKGGEWNMMPVW